MSVWHLSRGKLEEYLNEQVNFWWNIISFGLGNSLVQCWELLELKGLMELQHPSAIAHQIFADQNIFNCQLVFLCRLFQFWICIRIHVHFNHVYFFDLFPGSHQKFREFSWAFRDCNKFMLICVVKNIVEFVKVLSGNRYHLGLDHLGPC